MRYLRYIYFIFPLIAFILMLMPRAIEMRFPTDTEEAIFFYSYFSLMPFGYADIGPLLAGIGLSLILIFLFINLFFERPILLKLSLVFYAIVILFSYYHLFFNANGYSISIAILLILGALVIAPRAIIKSN